MRFQNTIKTVISGVFITSLLSISQANAAVKSLDLKTINKINANCMEAARNAKHNVAIAIFDEGGVLLSFVKTDQASPAAGDVARWKGLSAALYRTATAETAKWQVPTAPNIATIPGGVPIFTSDRTAIGGIGVSGAPPQFDESCGAQAVQSVGFLSK